MKQKLLIINFASFGYHIDTYEYCHKLKDQFDIKYICVDNGEKKLSLNGVNVCYISRKWPRIIRGVLFFLKSIFACAFFNGKIFVVYNETALLLKRILFFRKMHLDIRTMAVTSDEHFNQRWNEKLVKTIPLYESVSFISEGLRRKLLTEGSQKKTYILPLGTNYYNCSNKSNDGISLLYVGTFSNRRIEQTIFGIKLFLDKYPEYENKTKYTIIGSGSGKNLISDAVERCNLSKVVSMIGYIPHDQLPYYMESANVGLSFIPLTDYFDFQPPTKTFEYIGAGMFCIATKTSANCEIINEENGVLIDDTPEGVCFGLEKARQKLATINVSRVQKSIAEYTWDNIAKNILLEILYET